MIFSIKLIKEYSCWIFLDLSKSFDKINHTCLNIDYLVLTKSSNTVQNNNIRHNVATDTK